MALFNLCSKASPPPDLSELTNEEKQIVDEVIEELLDWIESWSNSDEFWYWVDSWDGDNGGSFDAIFAEAISLVIDARMAESLHSVRAASAAYEGN